VVAAVSVFRNEGKLATTVNDGAYTDNIGATGSGTYRYRVCEAATSTCSAEVTIAFG
jgi:serine protease